MMGTQHRNIQEVIGKLGNYGVRPNDPLNPDGTFNPDGQAWAGFEIAQNLIGMREIQLANLPPPERQDAVLGKFIVGESRADIDRAHDTGRGEYFPSYYGDYHLTWTSVEEAVAFVVTTLEGHSPAVRSTSAKRRRTEDFPTRRRVFLPIVWRTGMGTEHGSHCGALVLLAMGNHIDGWRVKRTEAFYIEPHPDPDKTGSLTDRYSLPWLAHLVLKQFRVERVFRYVFRDFFASRWVITLFVWVYGLLVW